MHNRHRLRSTMLALAGALLLGNAPLEDAQTLLQQGKQAEAFALVEQAAKAGDAAALAELGHYYEEGRGVPASMDKAAELYRQAADKGDATARWRLGVMIDEGTAPGDTSDAVLLFKQAIYQGNTQAMTSLAVMYAMGRGVPQDFAQARMHYEMAARLADPHGFAGLGVLYARGEGVEQNVEEAVAYWLIADQLGDETAARYLQGLWEQLGAADRERLVARANALLGEMGLAPKPAG